MKYALLASAALVTLAAGSMAQAADEPAVTGTAAAAAATAPAPGATAVTDDEAKKVAMISTESQPIAVDGQAKIKAAADEDAKAKAQTDLANALTAVVQKHGLTLDRYNQIADAAAADKALAAKIAAAGTAAPTP